MSAKRTIHKAKRIEKPWGFELLWAETEDYVGKLLFVKAGESLSLQYHEKKEETMHVESGVALFEAGPNKDELESFELKAGDSFHLPPGYLHRITAKTDCRIYEVSTPFLQDVVRMEDRYGRL